VQAWKKGYGETSFSRLNREESVSRLATTGVAEPTTRSEMVMEQQPATNLIARKVCWYETFAILFIVALIWLDEIIDIPYVLLGGPSTPINWRESLFESVLILLVGAVIIRHTSALLMRIGYLERVLPVCASCKKIPTDKVFWTKLEQFIADESKSGFIHGICPDCIDRYYPELRNQAKSDTEGSE
jgi:hypothetical protein